jgi:hypothetical protein
MKILYYKSSVLQDAQKIIIWYITFFFQMKNACITNPSQITAKSLITAKLH